MNTKSGLVDGLVGLPGDALLTEKRLAEALQVADRTARRMVVRGELPPPILFGCRRMWKVSAIRSWIDDLTAEVLRRQSRQLAEQAKAEVKMAAL